MTAEKRIERHRRLSNLAYDTTVKWVAAVIRMKLDKARIYDHQLDRIGRLKEMI